MKSYTVLFMKGVQQHTRRLLKKIQALVGRYLSNLLMSATEFNNFFTALQ